MERKGVYVCVREIEGRKTWTERETADGIDDRGDVRMHMERQLERWLEMNKIDKR